MKRKLNFAVLVLLNVAYVGCKSTVVAAEDDVQVTYSTVFTNGVDGIHGLGGGYNYGYTDVAMSSDGLNVYATGFLDNALSVFARNLTDGALTWSAIFENGQGGVEGLKEACALAVSSDGRNVYVTGKGSDALVVFDRSVTDGSLTYSTFFQNGVDGVKGLSDPVGVAVSPDGKNVYATGSGNMALVVFDRSAADTSLTYSMYFAWGQSGGVVEGLQGCQEVAVSPDGKTVYVAGRITGAQGKAGPASVTVFDRNLADGSLTWSTYHANGVDGVEGMDGAWSLTVAPDGKNVYVGAAYNLVVFDRASDGSLTYSTNFRGDWSSGVRSVAASADGLSVYVTGRFDNAMVAFDRSTSDGSLTYSSTFTNGQGGVGADVLTRASGVVVSPEGSTVCVMSEDSLVVFDRDAPEWFPSPSPPPPSPQSADIIALNAALLAAGSPLQVTAEDVETLDASSAEIYCVVSTDVATDLDKARRDAGLSSVCGADGCGGLCVEGWVVGVSAALVLVSGLIVGLIMRRQQQRSARTAAGMAITIPDKKLTYQTDNPAFGSAMNL